MESSIGHTFFVSYCGAQADLSHDELVQNRAVALFPGDVELAAYFLRIRDGAGRERDQRSRFEEHIQLVWRELGEHRPPARCAI